MAKVNGLAQFKINNLLGRFDEKQQVEKSAVLKKIQAGKLDIEKRRERDKDKLINKFRALRENLSEEQKAELNSLDRDFLSFKPSSNLLKKTLAPQTYIKQDTEEVEDQDADRRDDSDA